MRVEVLVIQATLPAALKFAGGVAAIYMIASMVLVSLHVAVGMGSCVWIDVPLTILDLPIQPMLASHEVQSWFLPKASAAEFIGFRAAIILVHTTMRWVFGGPIYFCIALVGRLLWGKYRASDESSRRRGAG